MERDHAADVIHLRDDIDLGLRMAERLAHMGETGSAVRLVDELRTMAAETLDPVPARRISEPVAQRSGAGGQRVRRAIAIGSVAAALGIGSAAALVSPPTPDSTPAKEVPSTVERKAPSGTMDAEIDVADDATSGHADAFQAPAPGSAAVQPPAGSLDAPAPGDAADPGDDGGFGLPNDLRDPAKHLPDPALEEPQPILTP